MKKRLLAAALALCLMGSVAGTAFAADTSEPTTTPESTVTATSDPEASAAPSASPAASEQPTAEPTESAEPEASAEPSPAADADEQVTLIEAASDITGTEDGATFAVSGAQGALPEGSTFKSSYLGTKGDISEDDGELAKIDAALTAANLGQDYFIAFEYSIENNGANVEPSSEVAVTAKYLGLDYNTASAELVHLVDNGNGGYAAEKIENAVFGEETVNYDGEEMTVKTVTFTTDSFSPYAITYKITDSQNQNVETVATVITDSSYVGKSANKQSEQGLSSVDGVTIDVFDYRVANKNFGTYDDAENRTSQNESNYESKYENSGINNGKSLKFTAKGFGTEANGNNSSINAWTGNTSNSSGGPVTGIVQDALGSDGYPILTAGKLCGANTYSSADSLAYLFNREESDYKKVYSDTKGLLKLKDGYYKYDCTEDFASLSSDGQFTLYKPAVKSDGKMSDQSVKGQFFPFATIGENSGIQRNTDQASESLNHFFGMHMSATFAQTSNGKYNNQDMVFEFSGDDDVWVFIDGKLVGDVGGLHDALKLTINFCTGEIKVLDASTNSNGNLKNNDKQFGNTKYISDIFGSEACGTGDMAKTFASGTTHKIDFFYLERGSGNSNLSMSMNLNVLPSNTVKKVDASGNALSGAEFALYKADENWAATGDAIATYTSGSDGTFTLTDGNAAYDFQTQASSNTNYILRETAAPSGYEKAADIKLKFDTGAKQLKLVDTSRTDVELATNSTSKQTRYTGVTITVKDEAVKPVEPDPTITKTADKYDGKYEYDLALTVSSTVESTETKTPVDVLFIVDNSKSMYSDGNDDKEDRMTPAAAAASSLAESLASNGNIDAMFAVVSFSTHIKTEAEREAVEQDSASNTDTPFNKDDAVPEMSWQALSNESNGKTNVYNKAYVTKPTDGGSTNTQAGLEYGLTMLQSARPNAQKYVVFISDGVPFAWYGTDNGTKYGAAALTKYYSNKYSDGYRYAYEKAIAAGEAYTNVNGFFTVMVGSSLAKIGNTEYRSGETFGSELVDAVKKANTGKAIKTGSYYSSTASGLAAEFAKIQSEITSIACTNVTITDKLSTNVEPVSGAQPYVVIKVTGTDGKVTTYSSNTEKVAGSQALDALGTEEANISAGFDSTDTTGKTFKLTFPTGYTLKANYTYEVHLDIKPTDATIAKGPTNYPDTADANTGTHSGQGGYYSNDGNATLTYTITGTTEPKEKKYDKPVVQVPTVGDLTISKSLSDGTNTLDGNGSYTFTVSTTDTTVNGDYTYTAGKTTGTVTFTNGTSGNITVAAKSSVTIKDLPYGTYTVTETAPTADLEVGVTTYKYDSVDYKVGTGEGEPSHTSGSAHLSSTHRTETVAVTNVYKPKFQTLTVTKEVKGEMGDTTKPFSFSLSLTKNNKAYDGEVKGKIGNATESALTKSGGNYTFDLTNGQSIAITVPYGYTAVVKETSTGEGYSTTATLGGTTVDNAATNGVSAEMTDNRTVVYTNTRNIVAPTGITTDTTPYAVMILTGVLALGAGATLTLRRKRRE